MLILIGYNVQQIAVVADLQSEKSSAETKKDMKTKLDTSEEAAITRICC